MLNKKSEIFKNFIDKKINNNSNYSITRSNEYIKKDKNIIEKINDIFKSKNYIYRAKVVIDYNDKTEEKIIIGKDKNNLITIDNELISIDEIKDIKIKS